MTVQRYPNPPLVPSSMSSGGEVHSSLAMQAPGSQPITPMPDPSLNLMELGVNQGLPVDTTPDDVDRNLIAADGSPRDPADASFPVRDPDSGRYTGTGGDPWKSAGSNEGGWRPV
jgi:hypothetical protein